MMNEQLSATVNENYYPRHLFPLVRHLSCRLTLLLCKLPITANLITVASIISGLVSILIFLVGTRTASIFGALLFVLSYVLDSSDGEFARIKGSESWFGDRLAEFGGWLVHAGLFVALGLVATDATGSVVWSWFGYIAALGATINMVLAFMLKGSPAASDDAKDPARTVGPAQLWGKVIWMDKLIYMFRELAHADFCFLIFALALFNKAWLILPLVAIGSQPYWIAALYKKAARFHS